MRKGGGYFFFFGSFFLWAVGLLVCRSEKSRLFVFTFSSCDMMSILRLSCTCAVCRVDRTVVGLAEVVVSSAPSEDF